MRDIANYNHPPPPRQAGWPIRQDKDLRRDLSHDIYMKSQFILQKDTIGDEYETMAEPLRL
jgi:hypothetical protein